ncbi:MAG: hypothetical protein QNJ09_00335, partial [Paracoccaceae bacterium]|nr:hypothetical protein [Paracoccaceae bacterium]
MTTGVRQGEEAGITQRFRIGLAAMAFLLVAGVAVGDTLTRQAQGFADRLDALSQAASPSRSARAQAFLEVADAAMPRRSKPASATSKNACARADREGEAACDSASSRSAKPCACRVS